MTEITLDNLAEADEEQLREMLSDLIRYQSEISHEIKLLSNATSYLDNATHSPSVFMKEHTTQVNNSTVEINAVLERLREERTKLERKINEVQEEWEKR